jgi:hypothetical protein
MNIINKIVRVLKNKKFNDFVNLIIVAPSMCLIHYNWEKFNIVCLFLSVFIIIKKILLDKILSTHFYLTTNTTSSSIKSDINNFSNKFGFVAIYKFVKVFFEILFYFSQYKFRYIISYNIWISGLIYFYYIVKYINKYIKKTKITKIKK